MTIFIRNTLLQTQTHTQACGQAVVVAVAVAAVLVAVVAAVAVVTAAARGEVGVKRRPPSHPSLLSRIRSSQTDCIAVYCIEMVLLVFLSVLRITTCDKIIKNHFTKLPESLFLMPVL